MTTRPNEIVVRTDADLEQMWRLVMGQKGPGQRSLWMVLLDEEGQLEPVIVPIDDVPLRPDSMEAGLAEVITGLRDLGDPALLLSRPGPGGMTEEDRQWGRMLAPLTRWAVHLYTPSGLQVFAPDDLVRTGNVVTPGSPVGSGRAPADTDRRSEKDRTVP